MNSNGVVLKRDCTVLFKRWKATLSLKTQFFSSWEGGGSLWKDNEDIPFPGRKWWCYQIVKEKPIAWNILHVRMVIICVRTSRVIGSQSVLNTFCVSGTVLCVCTSSHYSYFNSQDSPLQWRLSSFYRRRNRSSGKSSNLFGIIATVWGGIWTQGCPPHCTTLFQHFFSIIWLHEVMQCASFVAFLFQFNFLDRCTWFKIQRAWKIHPEKTSFHPCLLVPWVLPILLGREILCKYKQECVCMYMCISPFFT